MGNVIEMTDYDIILGPACSGGTFLLTSIQYIFNVCLAATVAGSVGKALNVALIMWGPQYSGGLLSIDKYPTLIATSAAGSKYFPSQIDLPS